MDTLEEQFREGRRITIIGVLVNLALVIAKFIGGYLGNSQALIADAVHSISDFVTDAVVLVGLRLGRKAPDQDHHFGHGRLETMASSFVGVALLVVAVYIGVEAARDIYGHVEHRPGPLALSVAFVSIVSKEILYRYTIIVGRRIRSQSVIANAWHHRSDAFSSVAVVIGVGAAWINPAWHMADAYAALVVSVFVAKAGVEVFLGSVWEFTDAAPQQEEVDRIRACALNVKGVLGVHDLKVRSLGGRYQMEVHIVVDGNMTVTQGHDIAKIVESCLLKDIESTERVIIHVDPAEK